jgi:hypothetical protein
LQSMTRTPWERLARVLFSVTACMSTILSNGAAAVNGFLAGRRRARSIFSLAFPLKSSAFSASSAVKLF